MNFSHRDHLRQIFDAAVAAVHPSRVLPSFFSLHADRLQIGEDVVPLSTFKKIYVAGAGKATGAMAEEVEKILGELINDGVIAVKEFPTATLKYIRPIVAGHPTPDANSVVAAEEIIKLVKCVGKDDLLVFLLSGGASSLITDLPPSCTLEELNSFYSTLINSGAAINEVNTVRKHLSQVKGGRLAKMCKGKIVSFIISDVINNDLSVIGSGPTAPDNSTYSDAVNVLKKYELEKTLPPSLRTTLEKGTENMIPDTPNTGDIKFKNCRNYIIADLIKALLAAESKAKSLGYETFLQKDFLSGNTEDEARIFVHQLRERRMQCIIAGGETTLKVSGSGMGGRNQHFALKALTYIKDDDAICLLAAGTDGSDGPTNATGAFADSAIYNKSLAMGINAEDYLRNNDAFNFFEKTGGLLFSGTTGTNVTDIVIGLRIGSV